MKRTDIFAALSASLLLAAAVSCTPDSLQITDGSYISLNLSSKAPETKGQPGSDLYNENIVNDVYYFFYKEGETSVAPVVKGSRKGLDFKEGVRTEAIPVASGTCAALFGSSDKCHAFLVANPPQSLKSFLDGSPTLTELRTKLFLSSLDGIQDSFTMIFDDVATKEAPAGNIMTVEANLRRLANKVTVSLEITKKVSMPAEYTSVPADAKVEFHNAFKETALGGDFAAVRSGDSEFKGKFFNSSAIGFGAPEESGSDKWSCTIERPIYSYAADWDFTQNSEPYLLIELPWKETSTGNTKKTYYKVFFSTKEFSINNWYHLTVDLNRLGGFQKEDPVSILEPLNYQVLDWNNAFEDGYGITTDIDAARYLMMDQTEFFLYNQDDWNFPYTSSHECVIVPSSERYLKINYRQRDTTHVRGNSRDMGTDSEGNPIYDCSLNGSLITFHHKLNNDFSSTETIDDIIYGNYDVVPYEFKLTIQHKDNPNYRQVVTVHQYPAIYVEAQPNSAGVKLEPGTGQQPTSYVHINSLLINDGSSKYTDEEGNPTNFIIKAGTTYNKYTYYGYGGETQTLVDDNSSIGNSNGNMYVITTTVTPVIDREECMLADPRQFLSIDENWKKDYNEQGEAIIDLYKTNYNMTVIARPSNFGDLGYPLTVEDNDIFEEAPALYGDSPRTLTYYYPTKSTEEAENIIAPKLRVASSWGQTYMLSYDKALRRCAAYQEDGYPAGRWRMPTKAEVMYICKLSSDHVIPQLFGQFGTKGTGLDVAADYWCSTGKVGVYKVEEKDGTLLNAYAPPVYTYETEHPFEATKSIAVRCVYDEWYWENRDYDNGTVKTTKGRLPASLWNTPYWGDMPR